MAQDTLSLESLQPKVEEARAAVKAVAQEIKADLVALIPSAPGWKCAEGRSRSRGIGAFCGCSKMTVSVRILISG